MTSNNNSLLEIQELNLKYLLLAQRLVREDRSSATLRLDLSAESVNFLENMTLDQAFKLSSSNALLMKFRLDGVGDLGKVTNPSRDNGLSSLHAALLLSSSAASGKFDPDEAVINE
ncbi:flagellar transcriptional regulator FlhD [Pseudomonas aeruginosa]